MTVRRFYLFVFAAFLSAAEPTQAQQLTTRRIVFDKLAQLRDKPMRYTDTSRYEIRDWSERPNWQDVLKELRRIHGDKNIIVTADGKWLLVVRRFNY